MSLPLIKEYRTTVPVTRIAGEYVDGVWTSISGAPFDITAIVSVAGPDERQMLPEGSRSRDAVAVYTATELLGINETTGQQGDRVEWESEMWEVQTVKQWRVGSLRHFTGIAVRVDRDAG